MLLEDVRDAATVILLRPGEAGVEVFLTRRHHRMAFLGGAYVFPGGKLDAADTEPESLARLPVGAAERCAATLPPTPGRALTPEAACGLYVAACRELFEEAGILLALGPLPDEAERARWRAALNHKRPEARFVDFLARFDLALDVDALVYAAHWITPSQEPKRYDTRFFIARAPDDQRPSTDHKEVTDERWLSPSAALRRCAAREVFMAPPTLRCLEELAAWERDPLDEILARVRARRVVPIMPKITQTPHGPGVVLPWDPLYPEADGEALAGALDFPSEVTARGGRIVLQDGLFVSIGPSGEGE